MESQARRLGCEIISDQALSIETGKNFIVKMHSSSEEGRAVILCMGASPRSLGLENEEDYIGHGCLIAPYATGSFSKERTSP